MLLGLKKWIKSLLPTSSYESLNVIEIKKDHIIHNFRHIQSLQPDHTIIPVVKSNAYGHGLQQICTILNTFSNKELPLIAVDSYPEYQIVADTTQKDILVLGETLTSNYHLYNPSRTHLAVGTLEVLQALIDTKKHRNIHLFLNTGMNREGFQEDTLQQALTLLQTTNQLHVVGVMSHLANADMSDNTFTEQQVLTFKSMMKKILSEGHQPIYIHISNSAGLSKIQDPLFTASRTGLALYGYNPLESGDKYHKHYIDLKPALRLTSTITALQHIKQGDGVSYGMKWISNKETLTATLPFGYNEGLPRSSGSGYQVYHHNNSLPLVGTVCMNLSIIDTERRDIHIGDQIEIIGWDKNKKNTIQELANINKTIPYTMLTGLEKGLKRIIV
ncbi:Alanine racemase [candidate division SR1 bacterium Aalborg_AAW-1]|nr:Alanine racemase [candidate division SR1 bacterium Aalborg_AAW-1]